MGINQKIPPEEIPAPPEEFPAPPEENPTQPEEIPAPPEEITEEPHIKQLYTSPVQNSKSFHPSSQGSEI